MSERTFATDPGSGGVESEYLGLPFKSTPCEDWYGFGDKRCPNRYIETGNLETDINSLIKWIGHYSGHGRTGWFVWATNELYKKQIEQSKILAQEEAKETTLPSIYGGQFVPPPQIQLSSEVNQILQKIESGQVLIPDWFQNTVNWVKDGSTPQDAFLQAYNHQVDAGNIHPPVIEEIEVKETWWVIRPSGIIEQLTVTQKFVDTMTTQGWIFSKEKPTIEEPQNQNISIVFYIGKGGDLKTHFGINSIVVTPDEAEQLAKWLFQHYNTKILFVMNRLTDDVRTHTMQQIKDLIVQKLKDDKPDSDDIDDDDIKKPQELGFMGAGAVGAIAGLVLLGFIIDHKVSKR